MNEVGETKICSRCHIEKPITEFYKSNPDYYRTECKECHLKLRKKWREETGYGHKYYLEHREKILAQTRDYAQAHREQHRGYMRKYDASDKRKECRKRNADQRRDYNRQYLKEHPEWARNYRHIWRQEHKGQLKDGWYKRTYGINLEQYEALLVAQGHRCAICGEPYNGSLCVDHDHSSGVVRGLLCNECNIALGMAHDDVVVLNNVISYLVKFNGEEDKFKFVEGEDA